MASRAQRRKNLIQIVALVIAVVVVITASVLFQNWWNNRPGPQPAEVAISVSNGSEQVEVTPYSVCEPGVECAENEVPVVPVPADGTMTLTLPKEIYDHDWALLKIYDDPAANSEAYYTSNQATEVTIPGSVDPTTAEDPTRPRLVVVEVTSVQIGTNEAGEETPYSVTWSIAAQ